MQISQTNQSQEQYQDPVTGMYLESPFEGDHNISVGEQSIQGVGRKRTSSRTSPGRGLNRPDIAEHHAKMNAIMSKQRRIRPNPYSVYNEGSIHQ